MKNLMNNITFSDCMLVLIVLSTVVATIGKIQYFNFSEIFKNYFEIFKDLNGKMNVFAFYMAIIFPMWLALYIKDFLPKDKIDYETELLIVTILTALFFSIFGIIFSLKEKMSDIKYKKNRSATEKIRLNKLVDSVLYINMFEIAISIFILILCFISGVLVERSMILKVLIYYLLFVLLINMFIVLKRLHVTMKEFM